MRFRAGSPYDLRGFAALTDDTGRTERVFAAAPAGPTPAVTATASSTAIPTATRQATFTDTPTPSATAAATAVATDSPGPTKTTDAVQLVDRESAISRLHQFAAGAQLVSERVGSLAVALAVGLALVAVRSIAVLVGAGARISDSDRSAAGRKRDVPSATPASTGYRLGQLGQVLR